MRFSQAFIRTHKEAPRDATTPSHQYLLRGGYIRMIGAGIYEFLPLGVRVLQKIAGVVRDEMNAAGAQEVLMPAMLPATYFKETGRYESFGSTLIRMQDRKGQELHLGPTHEEIITDMVRRDVDSYRQLPVNLYQIQMKYRDEPRPRAGLLRCREFLMKDAYSFDVSLEKAMESYETMRAAYCRIFDRLALQYRLVAADSGAMGGSTSAEIQVLADTGEDGIVACSACDYAANAEVADAREQVIHEVGEEQPRTKVPTPAARSIDEVSACLNVAPDRIIKALVYVAGDATVMALVRGDHEVNEIKLARALGVAEVVLASDAAVQQAAGVARGFVGPIGFKGRVLADPSVTVLRDAVCGAGEEGAHFIHVSCPRDIQAETVSIRQVATGDTCVRCGQPLRTYRGIEGGHIFVLGTHYTEKMNATFLDHDGKSKPIVMGCYGIGVSRLVATAVEQHHDEHGICWPMQIAPYHVVLVQLGKSDAVSEAAQTLYGELTAQGVEVLYDDRDERPGAKFKDADLLGIPLRLTVGERGLGTGTVELKARTSAQAETVPLAEAADRCAGQVRAALTPPG